MSHVLAAVFPAPRAAAEIREFPEPQLEPNSALLAVKYSEVCGTDVHLRQGLLPGVPYPIIPGHVTVGYLEKIRGCLNDVHGVAFKEGDAVTFLDVHRTCHACWYCLVAKATTRCPNRKVYGITYGIDAGLTGGWAEKLYLKPGTHCISLQQVPLESFMAGGCSLPTALHATERAEIQLGDTVLVLGSGPVGLSSLIFSRMCGAQKLLCIGAPDSRLQSALEVGANHVLDFTRCSDDQKQEWVRQHTQGRGADITIEATGNPEAVSDAMRFTRDAGRVVVVGQYTDRGETTFNPHSDLNKKHLDIRGCWGSDFSHFYRAAKIFADTNLRSPWETFKLTSYPLDQVNQALTSVETGQAIKALVCPSLGSTGTA